MSRGHLSNNIVTFMLVKYGIIDYTDNIERFFYIPQGEDVSKGTDENNW